MLPQTSSLLRRLRLQLLQQEVGRALSVALRVVLGPAPQVDAGLLDAPLRPPAQLAVGPARVGRQVQHVARAPAHHLVLQLPAAGLAEGPDHEEDRAALARAQVPGPHAGVVLPQVVEREQVAARQVEDVDVVADRRAVLGFVVWRGVSGTSDKWRR